MKRGKIFIKNKKTKIVTKNFFYGIYNHIVGDKASYYNGHKILCICKQNLIKSRGH
ncbi:hypothetical protein GCM10008903_01250 [Clostridium cadaveris]